MLSGGAEGGKEKSKTDVDVDVVGSQWVSSVSYKMNVDVSGDLSLTDWLIRPPYTTQL